AHPARRDVGYRAQVEHGDAEGRRRTDHLHGTARHAAGWLEREHDGLRRVRDVHRRDHAVPLGRRVPVLEHHADRASVTRSDEALRQLLGGYARRDRERLVVAHKVFGDTLQVDQGIGAWWRLTRRWTYRWGGGKYQRRSEEAGRWCNRHGCSRV